MHYLFECLHELSLNNIYIAITCKFYKTQKN